MSLPKLLAMAALLLFGLIGLVAIFKKGGGESSNPSIQKISTAMTTAPIEISFHDEVQVVVPAEEPKHEVSKQGHSKQEMAVAVQEPVSRIADIDLPDADRVEELFSKYGNQLPYVETVTYRSRVPWQKGRPAWLSDYAAHYNTSRHFIARSLNGSPDYNKQDLAEGDRFNVLSNDKNFEFALVVDTSRCKMWFYIVDLDKKEAILLKTYRVGLGRLDSSKLSGLLTPLGKYTLGGRVAIFKPKMTGPYQGRKVELITVFGTRWIPFESEVSNCTAPAKGFGIHGTPWNINAQGMMVEGEEGVGKYESDGCIRLITPDIEELFAIIISRPTTVEIVRDFSESSFAKDLNL